MRTPHFLQMKDETVFASEHFLKEKYLSKYQIQQNCELYTQEDLQVWQTLFDRCMENVQKWALPKCLEGIQFLGLTRDEIPSIAKLSDRLSKFSWRAIPVSGLIPPKPFLYFLSQRIFPVAVGVRKPEFLEYSADPDIFHEAFGHLCLLYDEDFRSYLEEYGRIALKAEADPAEEELFDAVSEACAIKASQDSTPEQILAIEEKIAFLRTQLSFLSDAHRLARLFWWTIEVGLVGQIDNPKIYGAALISSSKEGQCLSNSTIRKQRFDFDQCLNTSFDPSEEQKELFVISDFKTMKEALVTFSQRKGI